MSGFNSKNLACNNGQLIVHWDYVDTTETVANMQKSGFFNKAASRLEVNHIIHCIGSDGYGILRVNSVSGGVVDCDNAIKSSGDSD